MLGWAAAAASILLLVASSSPIAAADGSYFPLRAGNWWSYEELDDDGRPLSRETCAVLDATPAARLRHHRLPSRPADRDRGDLDLRARHRHGAAGARRRAVRGGLPRRRAGAAPVRRRQGRALDAPLDRVPRRGALRPRQLR